MGSIYCLMNTSYIKIVAIVFEIKGKNSYTMHVNQGVHLSIYESFICRYSEFIQLKKISAQINVPYSLR